MSVDAPVSTAGLLTAFRDKHVLVLGDAILDEYITGATVSLSPEAPVPVLKVHGSRSVLGGAANTAANIVSLGGRATLITLVGNDDVGLTLRRRAVEAGVALCGVDHGRITPRKTRVMGGRQQIVRLDYEETSVCTNAQQDEILDSVDRLADSAQIVVISDYAKGLVSPRLAAAIIDRAHRARCPVIVDPRPANRDCYQGCDYLTPNWREARAMLGLPDAEPSHGTIASVAEQLALALGTNVVMTLGAEGIAFCDRNATECFALPTHASEVFDVSGAGDTVVAAFALARSSGAGHRQAVELANQAAGIAVGKVGTSTVTVEEICPWAASARLVPRNGLAPLAGRLRSHGRLIATVNGAFDVLRTGHLQALDEARRFADVLIVTINSDASVTASRGVRPIVAERDRAEMLLALRAVDYVHIFDEPDPIAVLNEIQPDLHFECGVNGAVATTSPRATAALST